MKTPLFKIAEFLERLGVKAFGEELPVVPSIQPVMIVADRSPHLPQTRVPWGFAQAYVDPSDLAGPPARFAGAQVTCKAAGGARLIVTLSQATGDASGIAASQTFPYAAFRFVDSVLANTTVMGACTIEQPDPTVGPIRSLLEAIRSTAGTPIISLKNNRPLLFGGANVYQAAPLVAINDSPYPALLDVFLPPGRIFVAEAYSPGVDTVFNLAIQEFPA